MLSTLRDLFAHQEWGDAAHWRAIARHAGALEDEAIRRRLYHIQAVERAFLGVWRGAPFRPEPLESYPTIEALRQTAIRYHRDAAEFVANLDAKRLGERVRVPWFPEPQRPITLAETLQHLVMHSHYHRGQNATRLRELGGTPPLTDSIVWILEGRPAPAWD